MKQVLSGLTAALLMAAPSAAQTPAPPSSDPDAVLVEELVVTARERGPAW